MSSKIKDKHDTWHIFGIKSGAALQYELLFHIFKNMDPRYNTCLIFPIIEHSRIIHSKTSYWPISDKNPGFEGIWFINWCNMWCMLWPD